MNVGILGLGMCAPDEVRTNDWWPRESVARWTAAQAARRPPVMPAQMTAGMEHVRAAAAAYATDPFQGVVERRVIAAGETHLDLEERAAREAIGRAGLQPADIDLLLVHPMVPNVLLANPACELHDRLALAPACLGMAVEATAYSVFGQLALAEAAIAAGRARHALLVQSCVGSRIVDPTNPLTVVLGDCATALVLGPAPAGTGIAAFAHFTDGRYPRSLVLDSGSLIVDPEQLLEAQLRSADACKQAVDTALAQAGRTIADVEFLGVFQGTAWLQDVTARHLGATHARSVEVFRRFGYLSSASIPASLYIGCRDGLLGEGMLVLLTGGGTGMTYGAAVMHWGTQ